MAQSNLQNTRLVSINSSYIYVRGRQLEGTYPEDSGAWGTTAMRVHFGWGIVPQEVWPDTNALDAPEPPRVDETAKLYRLGGYRRVRDAKDCIESVRLQKPVLACLEITEQWNNAPFGVIEDITTEITPSNTHCVVIFDYNESDGRFMFINSWGSDWGNNGVGTLSSGYFDSWGVDCWSYLDIFWRNASEITAGIVGEGREYIVKNKKYIELTLSDYSADERIGWVICTPRDGYFDIEELYVRPQYRKQGFGKHLAQMAKELADQEGLPIKLWVSYADCYKQNQADILKVCKWLGLTIKKSPATWSGFVGVPGKANNNLLLL